MSGIVGKNLGRGSGVIAATPVGADAVSGSNVADDALGSEHYAAGSVDATALGADCVTAAKIGDDVINSEHLVAGSIDLEHMSSESVDEDNLHISNSGSNGQFLSKQSGDAGGLTWATVSTEVTSTGKFGANGDRGVFAGGHNGSTGVNTIDYITIPSPGNAVDFGNLNWNDQGGMAGVSNGSRGCFAGGYQVSVGYVNFIDYITIAIPGAANATDFGDLTAAMGSSTGCSNGSRGVFGGGFRSGVDWDTLDYITIATTGNATDFGDATTSRGDGSALANNVRGVFAGGETGNGGAVRVDTIDYITIATTGNATDFGDCAGNRQALTAVSSDVRGVWAGGVGGGTEIKYITIMTTGDVSDFGDMTGSGRNGMGSVSSGTRGVFGSNSAANIFDYITIATTGDATDFGDSSEGRGHAACSGD